MPDERTYLGMLKGVEPETFIFITVTSDHSALTRMSGEMTEEELWAYLHKQGMPDNEIQSRLEHARKNPV